MSEHILWPKEVLSDTVISEHADVSNINVVINYDFPNYTEDYVHRIGRTARAENSGTSYTFFTSESDKQADELVKVLKDAKQEVNPQLLQFVRRPQNMEGQVKFLSFLAYYYFCQYRKRIFQLAAPGRAVT